MEHDMTTARDVLTNAREQLLGKANVVATGVGYKITAGEKTPTLSVVCSVSEKMAAGRLAAQDVIPGTLDGVPTDVVATGRIRAFQARTDRWRPAPGGVSIGHHEITAGTLGCLVKKGGKIYILSNNHVLANSNDAIVGDIILQPGPYDGGRFPDDHIANLSDFVPISFQGEGGGGSSGCSIANNVADMMNSIARVLGSNARLQAVTTQVSDNLVDAAIAEPLSNANVRDEILEIGTVQGTESGVLDMAIRKSGRTTALTSGIIQQVDVTVNVQYGNQVARFTDQLLAGPMSQGGDSGSAVLDENNNLVGLLFAGSDNTTIINRIEHVFTALGVTL